jgi:hypothetical protein
MLQEQRRCLRFTEPASRVVFDTDGARASALTKLPGYSYNFNGSPTVPSPTRPATQVWAAVSTTAEDRVQALEGAWDVVERLEELRNPQPADFGAGAGQSRTIFGSSSSPEARSTVFLHQRRAGAVERLVVVRAEWFSVGGPTGMLWDNETDHLTFALDLFAPASWTGMPRELSRGNTIPQMVLRPSGTSGVLRLYAGQADLADPARFTIDYETSEGRGTVEGRLHPDDTVTMRVLTGPATRPAPLQKDAGERTGDGQ